MSMTQSQIQTLAAKDLIVCKYGSLITAWPLSVWEEQVRRHVQYLDDMPVGEQVRVRLQYA